MAEESRRAGWSASTRHERASDRAASSSVVYRDSFWCWTGTRIGADGGGIILSGVLSSLSGATATAMLRFLASSAAVSSDACRAFARAASSKAASA